MARIGRIVRTLLSTVLPLAHGLAPSMAVPNKFLVVGGTGRVGGSTAKWLHVLSRDRREQAQLLLGGRSAEAFERSRGRILQQFEHGASEPLPTIAFERIDLDTDDADALAEQLRRTSADCVVHTAGPFQQRTRPILLEASLKAGLPYVDVCDEPPLCAASKRLHDEAKARNCRTVVAAGIWPGTSALMAAEAVEELRRLEAPNSSPTDPCDGEQVELSFFTAGTGGADVTIVSATFLLLCQPALCYRNGRPEELEPWTSPKIVDFGKSVGERQVWLLDNPDVYTIHKALDTPTLSSRFATAPSAWNLLFGAMKALLPKAVLADKVLMQGLSALSMPVIRAVDQLVGATNAMRVEASGSKGSRVRFSVTHEDLEQCVGLATAAFALEVMSDAHIPAGVHFPAELPLLARQNILERVRRDAIVWEFESRGPRGDVARDGRP